MPDPDQLVQAMLVARQLALDVLRRAEHVARRMDRLVSLLRVLHLALVAARLGWNVLRAEQRRRLRARGREGGLGQRGRVGAHVGDVAVLVEALGDAHRRLRGEAELAARLLLQRRGHERRARPADVRLLLDAADREGNAVEARRTVRGRSPRRAAARRRSSASRPDRSRGPSRRVSRRARRVAPRTTPDRTSPGDPTSPRRRTPSAPARARPRAAWRRTARGRRRARA